MSDLHLAGTLVHPSVFGRHGSTQQRACVAHVSPSADSARAEAPLREKQHRAREGDHLRSTSFCRPTGRSPTSPPLPRCSSCLHHQEQVHPHRRQYRAPSPLPAPRRPGHRQHCTRPLAATAAPCRRRTPPPSRLPRPGRATGQAQTRRCSQRRRCEAPPHGPSSPPPAHSPPPPPRAGHPPQRQQPRARRCLPALPSTGRAPRCGRRRCVCPAP